MLFLIFSYSIVSILTLLRMVLLRAAYGWGRSKKTPLPKMSHTYISKMKLGTVMPYLKKMQKKQH